MIEDTKKFPFVANINKLLNFLLKLNVVFFLNCGFIAVSQMSAYFDLTCFLWFFAIFTKLLLKVVKTECAKESHGVLLMSALTSDQCAGLSDG